MIWHDERLMELTFVEFIYPELRRDPANPYTVTFDIHVSPSEPLSVAFVTFPKDTQPPALPTPPSSDPGDMASSARDLSASYTYRLDVEPPTKDVQKLAHLPPLTLELRLPDGYPAQKCPVVQLYQGKPEWFWIPESKIQELANAAFQMWKEMGRDQVVFSYIEYLRDAADRGFDLGKVAVTGPLVLDSSKKEYMLGYVSKYIKLLFDRETFGCGVCLEPKKGAVSYRLKVSVRFAPPYTLLRNRVSNV